MAFAARRRRRIARRLPARSATTTVGSTNAQALERARAGDPGRLWIVASAQQSGPRPARPRLGRRRTATSPRRCFWSAAASRRCRDARLRRRAGARRRACARSCRTAAIGIGVDGGGAGSDPLRAEMAERRAGRRRQARRHPARSRAAGRTAAMRWRSASASMSSRIPKACPIRRPRLPRSAPMPTPRRCSWRCPTPGPSMRAIWDEGRGFAAIRNRWLARAAGLGADVAVQRRRQRRARRVRDDRRRRPLRDPRRGGEMVRIAAGDVHFGAVAVGRLLHERAGKVV